MKRGFRCTVVVIALLVVVPVVDGGSILSAQNAGAGSTADAGSAPGVAEVTVAPTRMVVAVGSSVPLSVTYRIPDEEYQERDSQFLRISVATQGFSVGGVEYPQGILKDGRYVYRDEVTLTAPLVADGAVSPGTYEVPVVVEYQLCDDGGVCFSPQRETHTITLDVGGGGGSAGAGTLALFFVMALFGGLLLNIMPCVLPVLSLKALSLVKQSGENPRELRLGSVLYTAGVVASLTALAVVVIALKIAGERVGWGFQFQNPTFILVLITVIFVFALSLFEVFVISAPGVNRAAKLSGAGGRWGSFFSGVFAVLLATPCTAPLLGSALGFAFAQPPVVILAVFVLIGLGLASPFLLLGFFPRLIRIVPKPGSWMNWFRELMGFLLLGTVVWLLSVLRKQIGGENLIGVIAFLFVTATAVWVFGRLAGPARHRRTRIFGTILSVAIAVFGATTFVDLAPAAGVSGEMTTRSGEDTTDDIAAGDAATVPPGWERFSPQAVEAAVAGDQPVFVAFGASWCLTCKTNEATILLTDRGDALFDRTGVTRFYGDFTNSNPAIAEWIEMLGRAGVPLYAVYPASVKSVYEAELLPELLIYDALAGALESAAAGVDGAAAGPTGAGGAGGAGAPPVFESPDSAPRDSAFPASVPAVGRGGYEAAPLDP